MTRAWLLALLVLTACRDEGEQRLRVDGRFDPAQVEFSPPGHVRSLRVDARGWLLMRTDGTRVEARIPGYCTTKDGAVPMFVSPLALPQVGFDTVFSIEVTPSCPEAAQAEVQWTQVEGAPLELELGERGFTLRSRTLPRALPEPLPHGVVAVSPRTQGRYVFKAVASRAGTELAHWYVTVTSIARATGMSSLALSQRVLLGGKGWRVELAPPRSTPSLTQVEGGAQFTPDVPGRYLLKDRAGELLELQALTHERTPLDCGRAECHASLSDAARTTAMSHALEVPFAEGSERDASCMLACHATGEPGLDDGGFVAVARELHEHWASVTPPSGLPRALQRLAGVRCTSCHGPATIPLPGERARVLRSDVCASCHDFPPSYTHVAEWRASRMARSDERPETRASLACARCHTTGGFLHQQGVRVRDDLSRDPDGASVGISCAACHAAHGEHEGKLVRAQEGDPSWTAPTRLCAQCHAPDATALAPAASAAPIWAGLVDLPAGMALGRVEGPSPHRELGCIGCHGRSANDKLDHSFRVDVSACAACHLTPPTASTLSEQASAILDRLAPGCGLDAHDRPRDPTCSGDELTARYLALLVQRDPAAAAHNAPFARQLLERAEQLAPADTDGGMPLTADPLLAPPAP